jgi:cell division septal protein FtsQ
MASISADDRRLYHLLVWSRRLMWLAFVLVGLAGLVLWVLFLTHLPELRASANPGG